MSCFCSPLSTRSLHTRQHLSALSSLFHVIDVKKDFDGFSTVENRTQLLLEERGCTLAGKRFVMLLQDPFQVLHARVWSREEGSPTLLSCLLRNKLLSQIASQGHPFHMCASWQWRENSGISIHS